jgi:hypothetical protein
MGDQQQLVDTSVISDSPKSDDVKPGIFQTVGKKANDMYKDKKLMSNLMIGLMVLTLLIAVYVLYTNPELRDMKWKHMLCLPGCGCGKHEKKGRQVQFSSMSEQIANLRK